MYQTRTIRKLFVCVIILSLLPLYLFEKAFAATPTAVIFVADDHLASGETSLVRITFSEAVTGFDLADLTIGSGTLGGLLTNYDNINYTATLTPPLSNFSGPFHISLDHSGVTAAGVAGNGTTISNNYFVDTVGPSVTSVDVPANGTYGAGEDLNFTVNMDEVVFVTDTPTISIVVGTTTVYATYAGGSGSNALRFRYTVQTGLSDSNGITIGALSLNGGSIMDEAGNAAALMFNNVGSTANVLVNAIAPTITSMSPTSGPTSGGTIVTLTGTNLTDATAVKFGATAASYTVNSATQITATAPAGSAGTVDVTVTTPGGTSVTSGVAQYTRFVVTYAISPLSDEALNALTAGYASGMQETKTVNLTRTGSGDLVSLTTTLGGTNASSFTITQPTVTKLNGGKPSTTFTVKANDGLAAGTYKATVTVSASGMTPVTFNVTQVVNSGSSVGTTPVGTTPLASTHLDIDQNGIMIDSAKIDSSKPSVTLEVTPKDGFAYVSIPASILTSIEGKNATFFIEIKTPYGSYQVPVNLASLIPGLKDLLAKNNVNNDDISFKITLTDKSGDKDIQAVFANSLPNGQAMGAIVDFHIDIINTKTGQAIGTADKFSKALTRVIPMPKSVAGMPAQWGAFRYNVTTKKLEFVAAEKKQIDGVWVVKISSYSNSVYVVAQNTVSFVDVQQHWSQSDVDLAAAKGLVEGVGGGLYDPNKAVTRAEFTAMLVRALGRGTSDKDISPYNDVRPGTWYSGEVSIAKELGLLAFVKENSFSPNQPLTREEMASMLAAVAGLEQLPISKEPVSLNGFKDIGNADTAYLEDLRLMVKLDIMTGTGANTFDPKGESTRAQAAVVFIRMLQTMGSIDR